MFNISLPEPWQETERYYTSLERESKKHPCPHSPFGGTSQEAECCEKFYEMLKEGTVKPEWE